MINVKPSHKVELNFFYLHFRDAQKFQELASEEETKLESFYSRHAILSTIFAAEALINKIYDDFYLYDYALDIFDKMSIKEKWIIAPLVCGLKKPVSKKFNISQEPFQSFAEIIKIRNWYVHPKPDNYVPAQKTSDTISLIGENKNIPWVDTFKGKSWSQTHFPKNPFELNAKHADKATSILIEMIDELLVIFKGVFNKEWLWEIDLRTLVNGNSEKITIDSLWGGYTPKK